MRGCNIISLTWLRVAWGHHLKGKDVDLLSHLQAQGWPLRGVLEVAPRTE